MINHIHILGASGSGTTTLGKALSTELGYRHFDTDNYFWVPTKPPFQQKRELDERQKLLQKDLEGNDRWILTGSLCGWGDVFIPLFDLAVYLWIPQDIRIHRLMEREKQRYGEEAIKPAGEMYESHKTFIEWASQYDNGDINIRSKALHDIWLGELPCPVLRLEGDMTVEGRVEAVLKQVEGNMK